LICRRFAHEWSSASDQPTGDQILFRQVNEEIATLIADRLEPGVKLFICECGDDYCAEAVEMTMDEYEALRADGARFVVAAGHESDPDQSVFERRARFVVVEKVGAARSSALESDPRR
jgi:hypothetical protein